MESLATVVFFEGTGWDILLLFTPGFLALGIVTARLSVHIYKRFVNRHLKRNQGPVF